MNSSDRVLEGTLHTITDLHVPKVCSLCKGSLEYAGLGEYVCNKCGNVERDDYGKVRSYIETHQDTKLAVVARETGVPRHSVQRLLDEGRLQTVNQKYVESE